MLSHSRRARPRGSGMTRRRLTCGSSLWRSAFFANLLSGSCLLFSRALSSRRDYEDISRRSGPAAVQQFSRLWGRAATEVRMCCGGVLENRPVTHSSACTDY